MARKLEGKLVLVGGDVTAVIKVLVSSLLSEGCRLVLPARSIDQIQAVRKGLDPGKAGKLVSMLVDYPDYEHTTDLFESIAEQYGKIDLAIICVETKCSAKPLMETDYLDWEKMIDQNITPFFISVRLMIAHLKQDGNGMFIIMRQERAGKLDSRHPLSFLSRIMQVEMSKLIEEEANAHNVKYRFVLSSALAATATRLSPNSTNAEESRIAASIIKLYKQSLEKKELVDSSFSIHN